MKIVYDTYDSPIGLIHVVVDEIGVKKKYLFLKRIGKII